MTRKHLPNRRRALTFDYECGGLRYTATVGYFPDGGGRLGEIFLTSHKLGSAADTMARDAAVTASIALQHGVGVDELRKSLMRDHNGTAQSPLGVVLDLLANGGLE